MVDHLKSLLVYFSKRKKIIFILFSLCLHLVVYKLAKESPRNSFFNKNKKKNTSDKLVFSIYQKKKIEKKISLKDKTIVETPLKETQSPKKTKYLGKTNHIAKKEQKLSKKHKVQSKAQDPINNKPVSKVSKKPVLSKKKPKKPKRIERTLKDKDFAKASTNNLKPKIFARAKTSFPKVSHLIQDSLAQIDQQSEQGYVDFLEDKSLAEGDFIDINTQEYRYISYFTKMRKAIELAWEYPMKAARRGWQGKVRLAFVIHKNGYVTNVKVVKSSGYKILDSSVVTAIQIAAPFPPLPQSFTTKKLPITGTFNYVLGGFAGSY